MKRAFWMPLLLFCFWLPPASPAQDLANPLSAAVMSRYRLVRRNIVESAELMPPEGYPFRLTPQQRSFAEWLTHTAMGNYNVCAAMKGEAPPETEPLMKLRAKADIEEALRRSFEACDTTLLNMTDARALTAIRKKDSTVYPVQGMLGLIASLNEHYGNLVCYLRAKGLTPPSTARSNRPVPLPEKRLEKNK